MGCDGGSTFENQLPPNMNIYVTTAANAKEYSYATYCPPEDIINGIEFHSCLGDLYSINWMENAESAGETETLETQYMLVKESTRSHVMQYGTMNFTSDAIGGYIGADKSDFLLRQERAAALIKEIRSRQKLDFLFHDLVMKVTRSSKMFFSDAKLPVGGCECCDKVHEAMYRYCGGYDDYSLQYARVVVNLCSTSSPNTIIRHLKSLC